MARLGRDATAAKFIAHEGPGSTLHHSAPIAGNRGGFRNHIGRLTPIGQCHRPIGKNAVSCLRLHCCCSAATRANRKADPFPEQHQTIVERRARHMMRRTNLAQAAQFERP